MNDVYDEVIEKRETNSEFIERVMSFGCPTGGLIQVFVIEALYHYCEDVIRAKPEETENGFLAPGAWRRTAEWLKTELDNKYKR